MYEMDWSKTRSINHGHGWVSGGSEDKNMSQFLRFSGTNPTHSLDIEAHFLSFLVDFGNRELMYAINVHNSSIERH